MGPRKDNAGRTRRDQGPAARGLEQFLRGDYCTRSPTLPHTCPPLPTACMERWVDFSFICSCNPAIPRTYTESPGPRCRDSTPVLRSPRAASARAQNEHCSHRRQEGYWARMELKPVARPYSLNHPREVGLAVDEGCRPGLEGLEPYPFPPTQK